MARVLPRLAVFFALAAMAVLFFDGTALAAEGGYLAGYTEPDPRPTGVSWWSTLAYLLSLLAVFAFVLILAYLAARLLSSHFTKAAGATATELGHPIVLDPVGAGASALRTQTAGELLDAYGVKVIRGNMSEMKALAGAATTTRGVDVNPDDAVTEDNLAESAAFAKELAATTGAVVAITGAIDLVADAKRAVAIRNGTPIMGKITGTGCMLSCVTAAYAVANPDMLLEAVVAAVAGSGVAGEMALARMQPVDGNASFRTFLIDALYNMNGEALEAVARIEEL